MTETTCRHKLEWTPPDGTWRRTARCTRPLSHPGPHNGEGYTWGKFGVPPTEDVGCPMTPETAAALRAACHDLILQSGFADRTALQLRTDAEAHAARAEGLRRAANVITNALAEADR